MKTTVIVVAHRTHQWLEKCLASARSEADEVLLVDNGSDSGDVSERGRNGGATVVRLPTNLGFPAAVNAGLRLATGDVVALLNDDAFAVPGWLESAAAELEDESIGAVTPKLVFAFPFAVLQFDDDPHFAGSDPRPLGRALRSVEVDGRDVLAALVGPGVHRLETGVMEGREGQWRWTTGRDPIYVPLPEGGADHLMVDGERLPVRATTTLVNSAGTYLSANGFGGDYGFAGRDDGAFDVPTDRFGGCGAALVTRASTVARIGPLAADFFAYYEDLDWSWRVQLGGLRFRYQPAGVVRHVGGVTTGGPQSSRVQSLAARNRLLCLARNAPLPVVGREVRRARDAGPPPDLSRQLARRLPVALAQRARLARGWERTPRDVWRSWAGVNERWPDSAPS